MPNASKPKNVEAIPIIRFAQEHGFVIHAMGYEYYLDNVVELGHCPCDKTRKSCPCPESVVEVRENGHCLCGLLWRDYGTYLKKKFRLVNDV